MSGRPPSFAAGRPNRRGAPIDASSVVPFHPNRQRPTRGIESTGQRIDAVIACFTFQRDSPIQKVLEPATQIDARFGDRPAERNTVVLVAEEVRANTRTDEWVHDATLP